jgi:hypothetical protein
MLIPTLALLFAFSPAATPPHPVSAHDVIWSSPSRDENGSMPFGNGDLAGNAWWDADGTLWMYLSKSDAWDGNARLLKLGRVAIRLDRAPPTDEGFRQRLDLAEGEIECTIGSGYRASIRADANAPVIVIEIETEEPTRVTASLEHWRLAPREVTELSWSDVFCVDHGAPGIRPTITMPDVVLPATTAPRGAELLWYQHNDRTPIPASFELQGLADLLPTYRDPILHRTFGSLLTGPGTEPSGERAIRSNEPRRSHRIEIWAATRHPSTPESFVAELRALPDDSARSGDWSPESAEAAAHHRRWWNAFWDRSWIRVRENGSARPFLLPDNSHPVRFGFDSKGANRLAGTIDQVLLYDRPLGADEVAAMRQGRAPIDATLAWSADGPPSVPDDVRLDGRDGLSVVAWLVPGAEAPGGGRIVDKATAGGSDGWLLDTYPGNSLRFIAGDTAVTFDARLEPGRRVLVVATYDARDGRRRLFLNGEPIASTDERRSPADSISQAYALQRFITACAGRGGSPIKFNGSLFTVGRAGHDGGDPDYRKWGPGYWFQNTRLIYWPLFASGDIDCTEAFFAMYRDALPLAIARSARYDRLATESSGAAAFFETILLWGLPDNSTFGWRRDGAPAGQVLNPYIRYYRSGSLELLAMALERHDHRPDDRFLRTTILPFADAFLAFYANAYPRNPDGTIRFEPAASLETWHDATDPLPEIAALRFVIPRLLSLDSTIVDQPRRDRWKALLDSLPPMPIGRRAESAEETLLPAARAAALANVENPELYAIFPYRLYGVGLPARDLAERTFAARANRANVGWCQDSIQAAHLGLADDAMSMLAARSERRDAKSRFPAFWGPNYDWIPDQDHGANIMTTLQSMLMQCIGRRILIMPAWPRGFDCDFKLHAPHETTLTGSIRDGRVTSLAVWPPERLADVEFMNDADGLR